MKINLKDLFDIQENVNLEVSKKLGREISVEEYMLAFTVEFYELVNAIGTWKWWKHSHVPNREKVLDELADCFAFYLSMVIALGRSNEEIYNKLKEEIEMITQEILDNLKNIENQLKEEDVEYSNIDNINNWIKFFGSNGDSVTSSSPEAFGFDIFDTFTKKFALAIYMVSILFENITWNEIVNAYEKKSLENIERQKRNY